MFCVRCGKENAVESKYCGYCGTPIPTLESISVRNQAKTPSKEEIDIAYYRANLQMQQEALELQRQELEVARQQMEEQEKQNQAMMKCPRCGSLSLAGNKKGYGIGKGVVGAAMFGPLGLMAGNIGSKKVIITCMKCGHKFKK